MYIPWHIVLVGDFVTTNDTRNIFYAYCISGRPVICVHISPVQTYFLVVAYGPVKEQGKATSKVNITV